MSRRYSPIEKKAADFLSRFPAFKKFVKRSWYFYNLAIYKKDYTYKIFSDSALTLINLENYNTFFGYYDKTPFNPSNFDSIIFHKNLHDAGKKPNPHIPVDICSYSIGKKEFEKVGESFSWNYQQGSRLHWVSDKKIIFNIYNSSEDKYMARMMDIEKREKNDLPLPVYDSYAEQYALSLNFDRLSLLRPDYGYRNRNHVLKDIKPHSDNDGVWYMDMVSGDHKLIITLDDLLHFSPKPSMKNAWHKVNHLMIGPDGNKFVFLHRWLLNGRKFDRLYLYDLKNEKLSLLLDEDMVSHYSWMDNSRIILYGRHNGQDNYYILNIDNLDTVTLLDGALHLLGDGHPSVCKKNNNIILTDTYPDKSRMRRLILINRVTGEYNILGEFYEPFKFDGETRCDLHANMNPDCSWIHLDTIFLNKRCLALIKAEPD